MNGISGFSCIRGVCLAELLIGMAAAILVLAGCLEMLKLAQTAVGGNQRTILQQQDLRAGFEVFEQEARLATADSLISVTENEFAFFANIHAQQTNITATVITGQSVLPVLDGSGWREGKTVAVCNEHLCERHRLSHAGQRYQLTLSEPVATMHPAGASVEMRNRVVYYTRENEGSISLMRMVDGGAGVLIGDLKSILFSYRDKNGRVTNTPSEIVRVLLHIEPQNTLKMENRGVALRS